MIPTGSRVIFYKDTPRGRLGEKGVVIEATAFPDIQWSYYLIEFKDGGRISGPIKYAVKPLCLNCDEPYSNHAAGEKCIYAPTTWKGPTYV